MMKSAMELVVDAVHERIGNHVPYKFGNKHRSEFDTGARVIWVPRRGRLEAPDVLAHEHPHKPGFTMKPLFTNRLNIYAFIEAPSIGELESLWCEVLTATYDLLGTASRPGDYMITSEDDESGVSAGEYAQVVQQFDWELKLNRVSGVKTDATVWARPKVICTAQELTYAIDPLLDPGAP